MGFSSLAIEIYWGSGAIRTTSNIKINVRIGYLIFYK